MPSFSRWGCQNLRPAVYAASEPCAALLIGLVAAIVVSAAGLNRGPVQACAPSRSVVGDRQEPRFHRTPLRYLRQAVASVRGAQLTLHRHQTRLAAPAAA